MLWWLAEGWGDALACGKSAGFCQRWDLPWTGRHDSPPESRQRQDLAARATARHGGRLHHTPDVGRWAHWCHVRERWMLNIVGEGGPSPDTQGRESYGERVVSCRGVIFAGGWSGLRVLPDQSSKSMQRLKESGMCILGDQVALPSCQIVYVLVRVVECGVARYRHVYRKSTGRHNVM